MKVLVTKSVSSSTGFELKVVRDNGVEEIFPITKSCVEKKTGITWLNLPENPTGRKLFNVDKMDGLESVEITEKAIRVSSVEKSSSVKIPTNIERYLTEEEFATYKSLMAKVEKEMAKEKLRKEIEENQRKLAEMESLS